FMTTFVALCPSPIRTRVVGLAVSLAWVTSFGALVLRADEPRPFVARTLKPFLQEYCLSCHNAETKKAGLDLDKLSPDLEVASNFEAWVKVHDKVRAGEMPPGKKKPPENERQALLTRLRAELREAD